MDSHNSKGVGIVAILLIVSMLSLIGGVITMLVATGAVSKTNDLMREQAFGLVHAGFEYAFKRIDDGFDPNGDTKSLGNGSFTVNYVPGGTVTVNSTVNAMQATASPRFSVAAPSGGGGGDADCLVVNTSGAYLANGNADLEGITLENNCSDTSITITWMTVAWTPTSGARVRQIRIANTNVYNNNPGTPNGVPINIADYSISSCTTVNLTRIRHNGNMSGRTWTITFTMMDGSTRIATAGPL